ncbi:MAG: diguanylate cyclase [Deltaproteobacteria bacterium]|nr:diguanylate cyclase [Deltaproteobacteria bacterium]
MDGLELAGQLKKQDPDLEIVFITGHGTFDNAVRAIPIGAYDYLRKPIETNDLKLCLERFMERRRLQDKLAREEQRYTQLVQHLPSLIMVIKSNFELEFVNQASLPMLGYTPEQGDECLRQVAECIRSQLKRPGDLVARYGGEEFVVVLPDTNREGAMVVAKDIQKGMEALGIPHSASTVSDHVTLSQGVATGVADASAKPKTLVEAADHALYRAKEGGRNRVITA